MRENPILLEIFKNRYMSIAEEMGVTLQRTAFSPNIKERKDFSCAVFEKDGDLIAQAAHIPVHLGSMPLSVAAMIDGSTLMEGDMILMNDPFKGGTHLPDMTLLAPVFIGAGKPLFFVANRAHHADVGGMTAGSMPLSTTIFQEGLIIPPVKIVKQGRIEKDLLDFLLKNVRTPVEREGDLSAQIMANLTGVKRIKELLKRYDTQTVVAYSSELIRYAETVSRKSIASIPDGSYSYSDFLEDDGHGQRMIKIDVKLTIEGDRAIADFSQSDDQVAGCMNSVHAIVLSAVLYVFRCLLSEDIPTNSGIIKPVTVKTRKGSVVDAHFPAAVAGGNVETSQRIVDALFGALAQAIPDRIPAASQGTMNNITIGGCDPRNGAPYTYYETIGGGAGASKAAAGADALQTHMTNTLNTPVEALEYGYPFLITQYAIRKDSGGQGAQKGGNGIVREIEFLGPAEVTVITERRSRPPYGLWGGEPGKCGRNILVRGTRSIKKPAKFHIRVRPKDRLRIETPGGGGYGVEAD